MINQFDFAQKNEMHTQLNIGKSNFFLIEGVTSVMSHGDVEEFNRVFLVAAPTIEHAKTWVQLHYLLDSMCGTHQELIDEINENTIKEDEADCTAARFVGHLDVGDYKYRTIDRVLEITKDTAKQLLLIGNYYQTNIAINALN